MNLIVAVDRNWAIGKDNSLLESIPDDMKFFRETTTGNVVVMGRKTLESFPGGRPLKNRTNIVLTNNRAFEREGAIIVHSMDQLDDVLAQFDSDRIFVIGGASIYRLLLNRCDTAYITKIHNEYEADTWFPNLDEKPEWELASCSDTREYQDLTYCFCTYKKR
ncbi:MAG: dihydrofolate reductase [Eubacterium sp.]|nr:dihydrofolate reductase [Eubacterium sp.]